ncbi:M23 family metallopeptidase [Phormidium sp. CLA17]|uniref:LysM peptidoglycan-binding domain-containing M23 family metallopeptidase n=1 Tax=Leptolyngbya sp. Cla-17 TaxID=2803751 RepID=UPI00149137CC|nr:M23 family metallopeptidase [Leptolyngbya sp. Cla-17]MBM0744042.1 M23 family metallopeptidase [Leptolyngbya sp. Cla-17]
MPSHPSRFRHSVWSLFLLVALGWEFSFAANGVSQPARQFSGGETTPSSCPAPALSRLKRHTVAPGETLEAIAQKYSLIPATLLGFNPSLRGGKAPVGATLVVPPFNGVRVELQPGQSWREVAKAYKVRPDVLFEVNGCQRSPRVVFIPGVNWSPVGAATQALPRQSRVILSGYPLPATPAESAVLLNYGYGVQPETGKVGFHSGVDLAAPINTAVQAVGSGTIAFAGMQGALGNLVVVNHVEGLQTRYAQLGRIAVKVGQRVAQGQTIGMVGISGRPSSKQPHLHFEMRSRSNLGWVAEDPRAILLKNTRRAENR